MRTTVVVVLTWVVLGGTYASAPAAGVGSWAEVLRLLAGLAAIAAVFVWQTRSVARSDTPELRAIQALGVVVPLFLLGFALTYLSMSHASESAFTEPLNHVAALYLTITVLATVGFGDISPVSNGARLVVSIQMLLDLVLLGVVVRVIFSTARQRFEDRESDGD